MPSIAEQPLRPAPPFHVVIRICGVLIMVVGLLICAGAAYKAWTLFEEPAAVAALADRVESAAHLNAYIGQLTRQLMAVSSATVQLQGAAPPPAPAEQGAAGLNASYFFAWSIYLLLILIVAHIGLRAMAEGGKVAVRAEDPVIQFRRAIHELVLQLKAERQAGTPPGQNP